MVQATAPAARAAAAEKIRIRPGGSDDIPALLALERAAFATDRLSRRSFQHLLTRGHAIHRVAEADGALIGYAIVLLHAGTSLARLYSFAVHPDHQGLGVGRRLLEEVERCAVEDGCAFMRLEVRPDNVAAIERYRAAGYREFGSYPDYYDDHSAALRMQKRLVGGARPELARVPYYAQTLDFTCGPASLIMAMQALDPAVVAERKLELRLWRESTTIFMTSGHGGCGPYGLALAAWRRGFDVAVYGEAEAALFMDSVRTAEKKEILRLVHDDFSDQVAEARIPVSEQGLSGPDLDRHLRQGAVPIVLISSYRLYGEKAPHWVVVTGYDDSFFFIHDPYVDSDRHRAAADCINVPVTRREFDRMARYGSARLRAAVIVQRQRRARCRVT